MKECKKSCGTILPLKDGIFGFQKKMVYENVCYSTLLFIFLTHFKAPENVRKPLFFDFFRGYRNVAFG